MAQEGGWSKGNFGLQLGVMKPMGDLADMLGAGPSLAVFYEKVFSSGFAIKGRLEYSIMGGGGVSWDYWVEDEYYSYWHTETFNVKDMTQFGVMLDLVWYKDLKDTIYPFAGIGHFSRNRYTGYDSHYTSGAPGWITEYPDSELAVCAGLGFNFSRHFGTELKYTLCEYNWMQLSLLYRF
jgi:hypothetical protein